MKKLSFFEGEKLQEFNDFLLRATKINFVAQIEKFAINYSCTELEVKAFFKKNYPGADKPESLSLEDREFLSMLLRHYVQKDKEYEKLKKGEAIKLATPKPFPSLGFYDLADYSCLIHHDNNVNEEMELAVQELPFMVLSSCDSLVESIIQ